METGAVAMKVVGPFGTVNLVHVMTLSPPGLTVERWKSSMPNVVLA
jgi:hypothetical protein